MRSKGGIDIYHVEARVCKGKLKKVEFWYIWISLVIKIKTRDYYGVLWDVEKWRFVEWGKEGKKCLLEIAWRLCYLDTEKSMLYPSIRVNMWEREREREKRFFFTHQVFLHPLCFIFFSFLDVLILLWSANVLSLSFSSVTFVRKREERISGEV